MTERRDLVRDKGGILARFLRSSILPTLIATILMLGGGSLYRDQNSTNFRNELRNNVGSTLTLISARLQGIIRGSMTALSGLANDIVLDPGMTPQQFKALAAITIAQNPSIIRISLAPDGVVSTAFPDSERQRVEGRHLDRFVSSRTAMLRARAQARPVTAGSLSLPDGRSGLNIYLPVFVGQHHAPVFWGYIEAVVDDRAIYRMAGLTNDQGVPTQRFDTQTEMNIAIRDVSIASKTGNAAFGSISVFSRDPILQTLFLQGGIWELAGSPAKGWDQRPDNEDRIRLAILVATLLVAVPILLIFGFLGEHRWTLATLNRRNDQSLAISHRLNVALECSRFGIWEIDLETGSRTWDRRMYDLHGLHPDDSALERDMWKIHIHPDDRPSEQKTFSETLATLQEYRTDYRIVLPGDIRHVRHVGSVNVGPDGRRKITGISWDITDDMRLTDQLMDAKALAEARSAELAAAKDRIEHNALHDPLTNLGNRRMLDAVLDDLLGGQRPGHGGEAGGQAGTVALLHIDLDRFKQINDTLGHAAGDAMLVHASQVLRAHTGPQDIVARIGGDEFVVVVPNPVDGHLEAMSRQIILTMRQPVDYNGSACRFGVSIGIAIGGGTMTDARRLLVNADIALYRAKENGRNRYEFFNETLQAEIVSNKRMADEILEAIEKDQFTAWYQPQFDAETLQLCGVEALIRWNHPEKGLLTPDAFLPIAEDLNVMATLDRIVMERASIDIMRWTAAGLNIPKISVNVSARRLRDETLLASLDGVSFKPGQLCFELVEAIFLDGDDEIVTSNIAGLKALGIDIEIDDFGTGHTSIVSLLKIKPKRLKIDRQLVSPITHSVKEQALVRAIIDIGRSLGIGIVAEGVETMAHAEMLCLFGCDILQGYAFAKPLPAAEFAAFARRQLSLAS